MTERLYFDGGYTKIASTLDERSCLCGVYFLRDLGQVLGDTREALPSTVNLQRK